MTETERNRDTLTTVALRILGTVCGIAFIYAFISHCALLLTPWQLEYREGALLNQVSAALRGIDVYSTTTMGQYLNVYGLLYNAVAEEVTRLFGGGFFALRLVSFVAILAAILVLERLLAWKGVAPSFRMVFCLYLYVGLLFYVGPLARPDALGTLIFLAGIYIVERYGCNYPSLFAVSVLALLGFLIKPYFIVIGPLAISYAFLFHSRRLGLTMTALFLVGLLALLKTLDHFHPTYISSVLGVTSGSTSIVSLRDAYRYLLAQTLAFAGINSAILTLAAAGLVSRIWRQSLPDAAGTSGFALYGVVINGALLVGVLGSHQGAWLTYFNTLLLPFFLVWGAGHAMVLQHHGRPWLVAITALLASLLTVRAVNDCITEPAAFGRQDQAFQVASSLLVPQQEVLASPWLAGLLVTQGKAVYNSGQNEYLSGGARDRSLKLPGFGLSRKRIAEILHDYDASINERIMGQKFDLIVTDDMIERNRTDWMKLLRGRYVPTTQLEIGNFWREHAARWPEAAGGYGRESWKLTFWRPVAR